jgi:hypothetical protein
MSGNPKECRRNALECMQLAQTAPSPEAREHFAELSQTWLRLAGEIASGQALIDLLNNFEPERRAG